MIHKHLGIKLTDNVLYLYKGFSVEYLMSAVSWKIITRTFYTTLTEYWNWKLSELLSCVYIFFVIMLCFRLNKMGMQIG